MDTLQILKSRFGYEKYRPGQQEIVDAILGGRDVLAVMPTGAGKSLCYQLPALILPGITLVISPLISLMKDQVNALQDAGIPAVFLNSSLFSGEYAATVDRVVEGSCRIVYLAPEGIPRLMPALRGNGLEVSLIVIDEAHCVSQWGHDFRPGYLEITGIIRQFSPRPVAAAFTATATERVRGDILRLLELREPFRPVAGFNRGNLFLEVRRPSSKLAELSGLVKDRRGKSGIVYCATRKAVEEVCVELTAAGFAATRYHAGLPDAERSRNQDDFLYDRKTVMVATNAFGMGIDKSNVSFVIHYQMPKNIESYYQEAGRAGRDGEEAECILLYSPQDVRINTFLIKSAGEGERGDAASLRDGMVEHNLELLREMTFYATSGDCLRSRLLSYFGEESPHYCGSCSNCVGGYEETDITLEAQKIVSCVLRVERQGRRFGKTMITQILRGSKSEKIKSLGLDQLSTWGIMADTEIHRIRLLLDWLVGKGYLALSGEEYPVLATTEKSGEIVFEKKPIAVMLPRELPSIRERRTGPAAGDQGRPEPEPVDEMLLVRLRELRTRLAQEARIPAYIVFSDATLKDMCRKKPRTMEEFLSVSGVGRAKQEKYGPLFTGLIRNHADT